MPSLFAGTDALHADITSTASDIARLTQKRRRPMFRRCCGSLAVLSRAGSLGLPFGGRAPRVKTTTRRLVALSAAALAASTIVCSAGPCSPEIERMQERINARVEAAAGTGPSTSEGSNALLHRQPTPRSMAAAEGISPEIVKMVREAMTRAREADQAGDKATCEQALAEVQRTIGP